MIGLPSSHITSYTFIISRRMASCPTQPLPIPYSLSAANTSAGFRPTRLTRTTRHTTHGRCRGCQSKLDTVMLGSLPVAMIYSALRLVGIFLAAPKSMLSGPCRQDVIIVYLAPWVVDQQRQVWHVLTPRALTHIPLATIQVQSGR